MIETKDIERFWNYVDKRDSLDCWEWTGARQLGGYGQIRIARKTFPVHRIAYELVKGVIPKGLLVCHHCDNKPCVNPSHLFLGTHWDNAHDALKKGRLAVGERIAQSKLSERDVLEIRRIAKLGIKRCVLGRMFKINESTVSKIVLRKRWLHI